MRDIAPLLPDEPPRFAARRGQPRGFALLAVLWVLIGLAALALLGSRAARQELAATENRVDATRGQWAADGCLERARSAIDGALEDALRTPSGIAMRTGDGVAERENPWTWLDEIVADAPILRGTACHLTLHAAGATVDVNHADPEQLRALFVGLGATPEAADSLCDALDDWIDPDEVPRPKGAERDWYMQAGRVPPRNGPIASLAELHLVRGFDRFFGLDSLLSVESGRIVLPRAPLVVLASLPGMSSEAVARVAEMRARGQAPSDLSNFAGTLPAAVRATLLARYADLARLTTSEPDAWLLTATASQGPRGVSATIELRLVRAGTRAAIVRRRSW